MGNKIQRIYIGDHNLVYPKWKPSSSTIAYYPLTATDTVNDKSGNGKNLTNTGVTFGTVGNVSCATFNGSSYLNRSESLFTGSSTFTVNLWYRRTGTYAAHYNVFAVGTAGGTNSFIIWMTETDGKMMLGGWTNDRNTGYSLTENTWLNIVVTHSGGTVKVYGNGSLVYTGTVSYSIQSGYTGVGCGTTNNACMIGNLSNVIIENKVRTAQDVKDYYDGTKSLYS